MAERQEKEVSTDGEKQCRAKAKQAIEQMSSDVEWANADRANAKQLRPFNFFKGRWRGTSRPLEWLADLDIVLVPFGDGGDVKIMKGWRDIYTTENIIEQIPSAQKKLKAVIKEYVDLYKDQNPSIICVGHSLGGSLAIVSAFDIANSGLSEINGNDHIQVCAVAFDAPRVGNQAFNDALEKLPKTKVLRINNIKDIVAYWPPCDGYVDTGKILPINSEESTFLKSKGDYEGDQLLAKIAQWHALQVILHTVTGWRTEFDAMQVFQSKYIVPSDGSSG
ncbi:phospholipase A1-II 4-like [Zingiber officinale]|uniref:phospholipase A1-II 4-like n=1 Tax=Zingiber officinale TaxID=94328 RepID=UPI001C4B574F|nr:phospholipase A1-II 4-like [Zingiber officinale]